MILRLSACVIFSLFNSYTDWKNYKIHNKAVLVFAVLSLISALICAGVSGVLNALAGLAIMLSLMPLYALRMLGAGDVKAMMAIGLMLGFPEAVRALCCIFLGSGVLAVCMMLLRKNAAERIGVFFGYLKLCFQSFSLLPYAPRMDKNNDGSFRFSFGIALGMLFLLLYKFL